MSTTLYLDLETYSEIDLNLCGGYRYAEDCEIMLWGYALGKGPVKVWDLTQDKAMPDELWGYLNSADHLCAHNSQFDRVVLKNSKFNVNGLFDIKRWRDTMIRAYAHGLPGKLGDLCTIFKLPVTESKASSGRSLVPFFCKPQKIGKIIRRTKETNPAEWEEFKKYLELDIISMRRLDKLLPAWNDTPVERDLWHRDQRSNDYGVLIDQELARGAISAVSAEKAQKDAQTQEATDFAVSSATKRDQLLAFILASYGVALPDMKESTLTRRMDDQDLPEGVRKLISLRLDSCGTTVKKFDRMLYAVCKDGRIKGMTQFNGSQRCSRDAGRIVQLQNLARPSYPNYAINAAIEDVKTGAMHEAISNGSADFLYDGAISMLTSAIRGAFVPPATKKLVVSDLSAIEGRVLAWLANEEWKLKAYADFDAGLIPYDMYIFTYAATFGVDPGSVSRKTQRPLGKVLELFGGFQGGVGAFVTFSAINGVDLNALPDAAGPNIPQATWDAAARYYVKALEQKKTLGLSKEVFITCDSIKRMWRDKNPSIVRLWADLDSGVRHVLENPSAVVRINSLTIDKQGTWLRVRLPSGRYQCYPSANILDGKIRFLGINPYTHQWDWIYTFGGKVAQNSTQGMARDVLLREGLPRAQDAGYEVVFRVHDELPCETPDTPEFTHQELSRLLSITPTWAPGLPLAAAGFEAYRYRKD